MKCNNTFENIRKSLADLFGYQYMPKNIEAGYEYEANFEQNETIKKEKEENEKKEKEKREREEKEKEYKEKKGGKSLKNRKTLKNRSFKNKK